MKFSTLPWLLLLLGSSIAGAQDLDPAQPSAEQTPTPEAAPLNEPPAVTSDTAEVPPSVAEPEGEVELSAAELAELGLGGGGSEASAVDTSLKLYGFMDFNVFGVINKRDSPWRGLTGRKPSFFMGNFNMYISKNLSENIRTFGEVRFSYMPAGNPVPGSATGQYVVTDAADYADYNRPARWGGIEIERVYFEWSMHRYLALRVGQFLTPYGIWNVDHGSPTIISYSRPYAIGLNMFPERQTGFELLGKYQVSGRHSIGYHLTLSNGVGPISEFKDLDGNKAVGARLYWETDAVGDLRIGGSLYYGRDTASTEVPGLGPNGRLLYSEAITKQYDSLSLAADLLWKYKGLHLQSEIITQQRTYTDAGRVGSVSASTGTFLAPRNVTNWGWYGLLGYRFEWMGVMPYLVSQYNFHIDLASHLKLNNATVNGGLNIRPLEFVVLKVEYLYCWFPDGYFVSDDPIHMMQSQLAWAF